MKDFAAIDYETANSEHGLPNHQLHTVAAACGFNLENHHNAFADDEACAWIAREIL